VLLEVELLTELELVELLTVAFTLVPALHAELLIPPKASTSDEKKIENGFLSMGHLAF
jgi:hypothetical protein